MLRPALALPLALLVPLAAAAAPLRPFDSIEEFARSLGLKKGGWQTSIKVVAVDIQPPPGMEPARVAELKAGIAKTGGDEYECVGEPPTAVILPGILLADECSVSPIEGGNGRWSLSSTCKGGPGAPFVIVGEGSYSADRTTGRHSFDLATGGVKLHIVAETVSRFVGQCRPNVPLRLEVLKPERP